MQKSIITVGRFEIPVAIAGSGPNVLVSEVEGEDAPKS